MSRVRFVLLRLFSCGDLRRLRDVTGKAPLSSEVVELVILWCYGFGTVLDFFGRFRCESPAGRLPGQPCARLSAPLRVHEHQRVARGKRRGRVTRASFLTVRFLDIPKGGWSNQSVGTGRSPACPAGFCKAFLYVRKDNLFVPLLFKLLSCLHIYTITTFVILLIHTILQPFIKV